MATLIDANTDYLRFDAPAGWTSNTDCTMIFWLYHNTVQESFLFRDATSDLTVNAGWWNDTDGIQIYWNGTTPVNGTADTGTVWLSTGKWIFLAFVVDSSKPYIYIGDLTTPAADVGSYTTQQTGNGTQTAPGGHTIYLLNGGSNDARRLDGHCAMIHTLWGTALSLGQIRAQQFRPHPIPGSSLFLLPGFHGTTYPDLSGNGISITENGTSTSTVGIPLGPLFGRDITSPYKEIISVGNAGIMTPNTGYWGATY